MSLFDLAAILEALRTTVGSPRSIEKDDYRVELDLTEKFQGESMNNHWIVGHYFTNYMRDYEIIVDMLATLPDDTTFILGRYRYLFTHCVLAEISTALNDATWQVSWDDTFLYYDAWEKAGKPEGCFWGACVTLVRPGLKYLPGSPLSREWSERLEKPMNEVYIETSVHDISLVFHDVKIQKIARGNPLTGELIPIDEN
jgi:hypothetical protein